jgi:hypothetical protein
MKIDFRYEDVPEGFSQMASSLGVRILCPMDSLYEAGEPMNFKGTKEDFDTVIILLSENVEGTQH